MSTNERPKIGTIFTRRYDKSIWIVEGPNYIRKLASNEKVFFDQNPAGFAKTFEESGYIPGTAADSTLPSNDLIGTVRGVLKDKNSVQDSIWIKTGENRWNRLGGNDDSTRYHDDEFVNLEKVDTVAALSVFGHDLISKSISGQNQNSVGKSVQKLELSKDKLREVVTSSQERHELYAWLGAVGIRFT